MAASTSDGLHEFIRFGPNTSPREDCRICLKNLGMVPIFGDQNYPDISLEIVAFCGIQVTQDEEFPRYICPTCFSTIENAIALRTTAQRTDALLRRRKKRQTQVIELKPDATLIDVKLEMPEESVVESSSATIPTEPSMIKLEAISYDQALSQTYGLNIPQMPMYCIDKPIQQQQQELNYSSYSVTDAYASIETPPEPANTSRECSICNKMVHCKSYSRHVKNHDPSEREKRKAKAHELKQNGVRIPTVKKKKECNICKLVIDSKSMSRHMKRKHGGANNTEEPTTGSPGVPSITSLETG